MTLTDRVAPPISLSQLQRAVEGLGGFLWMGNNLHNSGTETFRELYGHAMVDARAIYNELNAILEEEEAHRGGTDRPQDFPMIGLTVDRAAVAPPPPTERHDQGCGPGTGLIDTSGRCPACKAQLKADSFGRQDLPLRVVVDANGAYWRDYGSHYSMCPVSEDNDAIVVLAAYERTGAASTEATPLAEHDAGCAIFRDNRQPGEPRRCTCGRASTEATERPDLLDEDALAEAVRRTALDHYQPEASASYAGRLAKHYARIVGAPEEEQSDD